MNPSRFIEGELPALEDLLQTMVKRTRGLKPDEIKSEDLDRPAGMPPEEE